MNESTFQIFPCDYRIPCHTHQCHGRAAYYIGRPNQKHTGTLQVLCEKCANELVESCVAFGEAVEVNADPVQVASVSEPVANVSEVPNDSEPLPFEDIEIEFNGKLLSDMTEKELKAACKELGIKGYSDKNKTELIALIDEATNDMAVEEVEKGNL